MPDNAWDQGFLMPELPAEQPWKRCLYCAGFELWQGTLASCQTRKMVLAPNAYCNARPDWSAEPAAEIIAGHY